MTASRRTCHKRRFGNEYDAGKWLKRLTWGVRDRDGGKVPVRVYYHEDCNGYHVTSKPDRYAKDN